MKIKRFNTTNALNTGRSDSRPSISIYSNGQILFNKSAMLLITGQEEPTDDLKFSLCMDEESPADWFVTTSDPNGFTVRVKKAGKYNTAVIQSSIISNAIFQHCKPPVYEKKSMRFLIQANPVDIDGQAYFLIITKPL